MKFIKKYNIVLAAVLLIIMLLLEISSSAQESQTIDEGVHLSAGYSYLVKNDFRMNPEHPPLIKELSALPLIFIQNELEPPFDKGSWEDYNQWQFAKDLIYYNQVSADTILFLGRLSIMLLSILLGIFIFKWSRELFGATGGLVSLLFYCLSPNIIAHSRYVTTDIALTAFFFITIYYFYHYLKSNKFLHLFLSGAFFAMAIASKFSAVLLIPIILLLFILFLLHKDHNLTVKIFRKLGIICLVYFILSFIVIFSAYGFEFKKPSEYRDVQIQRQQQTEIMQSGTIDEQPDLIISILNLTDPKKKSGKIIYWIENNVPVPAFSYFIGLTKVYFHNYYGHTSYLLGNYSEMGWWYYFPVSFLVKTPLITLIALLILPVLLAVSLIRKKMLSEKISHLFNQIPFFYILLVISPLFYFLFSLTSHLNIGLRHILVVYPFIFVIFGIYASLVNKKKLYKYPLIAILTIYAISTQFIYPHYLAFFNIISGGPDKGSKYLIDSNIDWGQDVKKLKKFMDTNNIDHVCLSYFGQAKLEYYDIDFRYLPDNNNFSSTENLNCVVAISLTSLMSKEKEYAWLLDYKPGNKIGYSIFIYDFRKQQ